MASRTRPSVWSGVVWWGGVGWAVLAGYRHAKLQQFHQADMGVDSMLLLTVVQAPPFMTNSGDGNRGQRPSTLASCRTDHTN